MGHLKHLWAPFDIAYKYWSEKTLQPKYGLSKPEYGSKNDFQCLTHARPGSDEHERSGGGELKTAQPLDLKNHVM